MDGASVVIAAWRALSDAGEIAPTVVVREAVARCSKHATKNNAPWPR
jgi:hypothetical protein